MHKRSSKTPGASRRSFLAGSATGLGSAWFASHWSGILQAQEHAQRISRSGQPGKLAFFSPEQAAEVESVAAQIIPADDTPGAREAGCLYFIDHVLSTFDRERQPVYVEGLESLQAKTRSLFPGFRDGAQECTGQLDKSRMHLRGAQVRAGCDRRGGAGPALDSSHSWPPVPGDSAAGIVPNPPNRP